MSMRLNCCIAVLSMSEVIYIHVGLTVRESWRPYLVVTTEHLTPDQLTTCYTCGKRGWSRKASAAQPCTSYQITSFKLFSDPENMGHCKKKEIKRKNSDHSNTEAKTFCQTLFYFKSNELEFRVNTPKMCHCSVGLHRTFPVPMKIHTDAGRGLVIRSKLRTCLLTTEPPWRPEDVYAALKQACLEGKLQIGQFKIQSSGQTADWSVNLCVIVR